MSGFSPQWLALRESLDAASRAEDLYAFLVADAAARPPRTSRLAVVDLGAGTGANLRYAAPLLGGGQDWLLVEHDPLLRAALEGRMKAWANESALQVSGDTQQLTLRGAGFDCQVRSLALDLATRLHELPLPNGVLLTASALLDLVSGRWLRALVRQAAAAAATVWFALTYDGRIDCSPVEPEDAEVRELFNRHQLGDKGFGPALGPGASRMAEQLLAEQGYRIHGAPSDWRVGPDQSGLQYALIRGWFDAACNVAPHRVPALHQWLARRGAHIDEARSELRIGHVDLIGRPALR